MLKLMSGSAKIIDRYAGMTHLGDGQPYVSRILEIVDRIQLLGDFNADEVNRLAPYLACYSAPATTEIIVEGTEGDFMLLLISGFVEVVKKDAFGTPKTVGLVGPGNTLGEMSMIDGLPRSASCIAVEDVIFAVLDRDNLTRIITDEPRIGTKILIELVQLLSQRLRNATSQLADYLDV